MTIEIKLSELTVGHYVVEIAKQKGTFSLRAPGHIKNGSVIQYLHKKCVESVIIDETKTLRQEAQNDPFADNFMKKDKKAIKVEVEKAKEIFSKAKNIQKELFAAALSGSPLDLAPVVEITNQSVDAIFNSPDSLACMVNIREKDEYLLEHSVAVSVYIILFSRYLKLDKKIVQELSIGAFLHDIGKIMIPDKVLNKPGKFTDNEFTIMKTHVNHSIDIIKKTPGISKISLEVAALHHEKIDGNGYPFNVKGKDITLYGRMISICDIFDALTATRVYKEGYPHIKAFSILRELAKKNHLDTTLVDQFIKCLGIFPVGSLVQLKSKKLAIVEQRNNEDPLNPKVRSFYSVKLNQYLNTQDIDLTETKDAILKGVRAEDFDLDMNKIVEILLMES